LICKDFTADLIRQQLPGMLFMLTTLGPLESVAFRGVGPGGFDVYDVKFAHGAAQVHLNMTADGKVQLGIFRPDGEGTTGVVVSCSQEATLRPTTGAAPIRMTFVNRSGGDIRLFGLDFAGKRLSRALSPTKARPP
jgi:bla regulator protein blaR1